jgi:hypothetical protein
MVILRLVRLGFSLMVFAIAAPANAADGCGPGCHGSPGGACVRDGWEQALPVRNECPATSRPSPPCGRYYRWSARAMMCIER